MENIDQLIHSFNPLRPNIHIPILLTDLHTFPQGISWENLIKDQSIFPLLITFSILITFSLDCVLILLGEISWLKDLRGLINKIILWKVLLAYFNIKFL